MGKKSWKNDLNVSWNVYGFVRTLPHVDASPVRKNPLPEVVTFTLKDDSGGHIGSVETLVPIVSLTAEICCGTQHEIRSLR